MSKPDPADLLRVQLEQARAQARGELAQLTEQLHARLSAATAPPSPSAQLAAQLAQAEAVCRQLQQPKAAARLAQLRARLLRTAAPGPALTVPPAPDDDPEGAP